MFVDTSLGSSKREAKIQLDQGCSQHGGFSNSFLVRVGQEAGRAYRGIQVKLNLWGRLYNPREQGRRLRGEAQELATAEEETSQGRWCCRNRRLGNARGVSDSCEHFYGFVLAHSL